MGLKKKKKERINLIAFCFLTPFFSSPSQKKLAYIGFSFVLGVPGGYQISHIRSDSLLRLTRIKVKKVDGSWNVQNDFGRRFVVFGQVDNLHEKKESRQRVDGA
jgi:hypothetical protein